MDARRSPSSGAPPLFFHSQIPAVRVCWSGEASAAFAVSPQHVVVLNLWETSGTAAALTWTAAASGSVSSLTVTMVILDGDPGSLLAFTGAKAH